MLGVEKINQIIGHFTSNLKILLTFLRSKSKEKDLSIYMTNNVLRQIKGFSHKGLYPLFYKYKKLYLFVCMLRNHA